MFGGAYTWRGLFSEFFGTFSPRKGIRIPEFEKFLHAESRVQEIFSCGIGDPGLWNMEYCSRNPELHQRLEFGIQVPLTNNPESMAWNPESKTVLDSHIWGNILENTL